MTHPRKGGRRLLGGALTLASAALLGACSSTPSSAGPGTSTSTSSSTSTTTPGATTTTFDQATNARADVTTPSTCHLAAGAWVWNGTVTNRGHVTNTYTIIVDFTDAAATVEDTKVATVRGLAPGRTADWTVSGAAGRAAVTCVIRSARIS
jgi:hypothetical protein